MCQSSGETTVSMRHLVLVLYIWLSGMQGGFPPCLPDSHPHRVTGTKCRIDKVVSPDVGHIVARNMERKEINTLRKIVHQSGFIYKIRSQRSICLYPRCEAWFTIIIPLPWFEPSTLRIKFSCFRAIPTLSALLLPIQILFGSANNILVGLSCCIVAILISRTSGMRRRVVY